MKFLHPAVDQHWHRTPSGQHRASLQEYVPAAAVSAGTLSLFLVSLNDID